MTDRKEVKKDSPLRGRHSGILANKEILILKDS
jgi:hypothetical protein